MIKKLTCNQRGLKTERAARRGRVGMITPWWEARGLRLLVLIIRRQVLSPSEEEVVWSLPTSSRFKKSPGGDFLNDTFTFWGVFGFEERRTEGGWKDLKMNTTTTYKIQVDPFARIDCS